jgi:hypothetical protein
METQHAFNLIVDEIRDSIAHGRKYGATQSERTIDAAAAG